MNIVYNRRKHMLYIMAAVLIFCTQWIKGSIQVQAAEYAVHTEISRDADYIEQLMWSQMETALLEGNHVEWHLDAELAAVTNDIEDTAAASAASVPAPAPAWRIDLTSAELELLERCVMAEGGGESYECQKAIACVIINRVLSDKYADTLEGVITQQGQFSTWPAHIQRVTVSNEVRQAVREALTTAYIPENVLYFRANRYHSWANDYCSIDNTFFSTP